jgi:hypothetical protein
MKEWASNALEGANSHLKLRITPLTKSSPSSRRRRRRAKWLSALGSELNDNFPRTIPRTLLLSLREPNVHLLHLVQVRSSRYSSQLDIESAEQSTSTSRSGESLDLCRHTPPGMPPRPKAPMACFGRKCSDELLDLSMDIEGILTDPSCFDLGCSATDDFAPVSISILNTRPTLQTIGVRSRKHRRSDAVRFRSAAGRWLIKLSNIAANQIAVDCRLSRESSPDGNGG